MLYGHLDKQPEMTGWAEDLGPWTPVIKGDKLYGRGGADDGYAIFGSLAALLALHEQDVPHARCVVMIEACEESGSYDLPYYVDHLAARIGNPALVVCLDSGCGNYDQLWLTTSLRGMTGGNLTVQVLEEGVHSGDASGVVPSSFRILRELLTRLEDPATGQIKPKELYVEIPAQRVEQARLGAEVLGTAIYDKFPFVEGMQPVTMDLTELVLNRTWRPQLAITGVGDMPALDSAGNVLRPKTSVKLSLRVPPTLSGAKAGQFVKQLLEKDPPYGAKVTFDLEKDGSGWNAPALVAVAGRGGQRGIAALLRCTGGLYGRGRQHSLHGHARREIPAGTVPDHRRARPAFQRARSERIPAHSHRQAREHGGCRCRRPAFPAGCQGLIRVDAR